MMKPGKNMKLPVKCHPRRRNGDVVDLTARRSALAEKAAEARQLATAPAYPRTVEGLREFVKAHAPLGILAADLATAFRLPVEAAAQMLEEMERLTMLDSATVNGVDVWYPPGHPPEAVQKAQAAEQAARSAERASRWKLPSDVIPQTAKRGDRAAYLESAGSGYRVTFGTASADDSGNFEFKVARQQPGGVFKTEAGARRSVAEWLADRWATPQVPQVPQVPTAEAIRAARQQVPTAAAASAVRTAAVAHAASVAKYAPNDVVVIRGGRRRYVLDHRVPPARGNPKKPARRNPLPAAAVTAAMTLLPYVVSALGQKLSAFNALPRVARKARLVALLNSRWLYAIPAVLPVARLVAKSGVAVDTLLDALAGHGQVAVRAGGAAAQAALARRANPRYRFPVGTRVVVTADIVDIKKGGRRFLAARAGDRGTVIDNRGHSDWPRVRLDDGRRITVDAESGELRRE